MTKSKNDKEMELEELKIVLVGIYSFLLIFSNYFKSNFEIAGLDFKTKYFIPNFLLKYKNFIFVFE